MKKSSKLLAVALIAMMSLGTMVGCGTTNDDSNDGKQVYIAATEPTYAPFDTTDESGNIVGFDMDLLDAIAENQGFKVEYKAFEFDAIVPALQSGNADIAAAAINVTSERAEKVDFSDKYMDSGKAIIVKVDNDTIKSDADLTADMKVAAQIGTAEADYVQELADSGKIKKAVILNQTTDCILQLQNGDVDAVFLDAPVAAYYQAKNGNTVKEVDAVLEPGEMAFAVAKGNTELLNKINTGLRNVIADGTYDKLVAKWFGDEA
jgi:ABC-type amino acid transport substrate-binding protein